MDAKELRIGNLLKHFQDGIDIYIIREVEPTILMLLNGDIKDTKGITFEPIPLTEEWEFRCGVKYKEVMGESWDRKWIDGLEVPNWIKYVHELQNWYYWTFKKVELTIKELV